MQVTGPNGQVYTVNADNAVTDANNVVVGRVDGGSFVDNAGGQVALADLAAQGFAFPDTYEFAPAQTQFDSPAPLVAATADHEPAFEVYALASGGTEDTRFVDPMQSGAQSALQVADQLTDSAFVAANPALAATAASALRQLAEAYEDSPEAVQTSIDYWTTIARQALAQGSWVLPENPPEAEPVRVTSPDGQTYTVGADNTVTDANNVVVGRVDRASGAFVDNSGNQVALADLANQGFQFPQGYTHAPSAGDNRPVPAEANRIVAQFFSDASVPFREHPDALSELPPAIRALIEAGGTLAGRVFLVTDGANPAIFDSPYGAFPLPAGAVPGLGDNARVFLAKTADHESEGGVLPGSAAGFAVLDERYAGWTQVPVYALTEINDVIDQAARAQGVPDAHLGHVRDALFKYDPSFGVLVPADVASAATALFSERHEQGSFLERLLPVVVSIGITVASAGAGAGAAAALGITGVGATAVTTGVAAAVSTTMTGGDFSDFATSWASMFVGGQVGNAVGSATAGLGATVSSGLSAVATSAVAQLISTGQLDPSVLLGAGAGAAGAAGLAGQFSPSAQPFVDGAARAAAIYLATGDRDAAVGAWLSTVANGVHTTPVSSDADPSVTGPAFSPSNGSNTFVEDATITDELTDEWDQVLVTAEQNIEAMFNEPFDMDPSDVAGMQRALANAYYAIAFGAQFESNPGAALQAAAMALSYVQSLEASGADVTQYATMVSDLQVLTDTGVFNLSYMEINGIVDAGRVVMVGKEGQPVYFDARDLAMMTKTEIPEGVLPPLVDMDAEP